MLKELDLVLQTQSTNTQLLSYDTTFQLGDFYLSPLLYRHTLFIESPVIPAIYLIHERKFQECHEEIMQQLSKLVRSLVRENTVDYKVMLTIRLLHILVILAHMLLYLRLVATYIVRTFEL